MRQLAFLERQDVAMVVLVKRWKICVKAEMDPASIPAFLWHILRRDALAYKSFSLEVKISGSVGIAVAPRDGSDFEALYKKSDAALALYHVKGSGKNFIMMV